jgi:hypothetical protein
VRAVVAPDVDGSVPAPGTCAPSSEGDHSGFVVVLRGLADTGDGINALSAATNASGDFVFTDVPAGSYVVEVRADGFALPDDTELLLTAGEDRTLDTLCAVRTAPPPAPVVLAPPPLVDAQNRVGGVGAPVALSVAAVDGAAVRVRESPDGAAPTRDEVVDASVAVPLVLDPTPGVDDDDVRRVWRVEVFAEDALGNTSVPTTFLITKDGEAPAAPDVEVLAGFDRVVVAPRSVDADVVGILVGYTLVPGVAAPGACPFGRPGVDDPVVHGTFVLEGGSPLPAPIAGVTLSGTPGQSWLSSSPPSTQPATSAVGQHRCKCAPTRLCSPGRRLRRCQLWEVRPPLPRSRVPSP